ncbi:nucleoporin (NUP54/57) [Novymonas esmeraldas]|uniref:Nucleoporin (NUP54/57) n=1 Tax=Novymonas esmeraldas TaxID=1808958 RepID=A0AAW0EVG7_9TRYP
MARYARRDKRHRRMNTHITVGTTELMRNTTLSPSLPLSLMMHPLLFHILPLLSHSLTYTHTHTHTHAHTPSLSRRALTSEGVAEVKRLRGDCVSSPPPPLLLHRSSSACVQRNMFGATAPSTGFAKAPASGGFGAATFGGTNTGAPATGATAASGFGGGFGGGGGAGGAGGFGAPASAPATTGFGAPASAPATTGFGAPASAPATTGFGAPASAPATTGFGAPAATGFGTGFGSNSTTAPATSGFGSAAGGGWGVQQPTAAAPPPAAPALPTVTLQDFTRQSALASYLVKLDQSYNALHPNCHFTAFVYNRCGAGQAMDAIQRDRYTAYLHGGGCSDEAYMAALQRNPDPARLYPAPIHFSQELLRRTERQKDAVRVLQSKVAELLVDVEAVAAMDAANVRRQREVEQEEMMLRYRWYSLLCKMELLRRHGSSYGEESLLNSRVEQLRQLLRAPGRYHQLLGELRPFLAEEASRVAMVTQQSANRSEARRLHSRQRQQGHTSAGAGAAAASSGADEPPLLRSEVDPDIMADWIQFAGQMQDGIETLECLLKTDLKEMQAITSRVEAS